jgi:hypothetical protein
MPEVERTTYVKKTLKALRKAKGLKGTDEGEGSYNTGVVDTKQQICLAIQKESGIFKQQLKEQRIF